MGAVLSMVITAMVRRLVHKHPQLLAEEGWNSDFRLDEIRLRNRDSYRERFSKEFPPVSLESIVWSLKLGTYLVFGIWFLSRRDSFGGFCASHHLLGTSFTVLTVSRAISSSSFVGITYPLILESAVVISPSFPLIIVALLVSLMDSPIHSNPRHMR